MAAAKVAQPSSLPPKFAANGHSLTGDIDLDGVARFDSPVQLTPPASRNSSASGSIDEPYEKVAYRQVESDEDAVFEEELGEKVDEARVIEPAALRQRPSMNRRKSIPIKIQKSTEGRYILTADEPELREILKRSLQMKTNGERSKQRKRFSDLVFTRQFTAFDRSNTSDGSPFYGFFTLFWLCIGFMIVKVAANNYKVSGSIFGTNEILDMMFSREVVVLGLSDVFMMLSTLFCVVLQKLIFANYLSWNSSGWAIQAVWQLVYVGGTIYWTIHRDWPWTHTVFIVLHCIVMLMKQHSYGFYNGYLSEVYKRKLILEKKLKQLDKLGVAASAGTPAATAIATSYFDEPQSKQLKKRRTSLQFSTDIKDKQEFSDLVELATAISSGQPLGFDQISAFLRVIRSEMDDLEKELKGRCSETKNYYPTNLTFREMATYIPLPTVVYELEYPRADEIKWDYVAEKAAATFGVIGVMIIVSQAFIYPVVMRTVQMKDTGMPLVDRLREFPWILNDLLFPFLVEYLMAWYVIWECVLNLLAELTYFADRGFYADWWNSVSWDQFARDWNVPVHNFLLRHVYHSSISSFRVSKPIATLITFSLSAIIHELVMWAIFKKLRGYLLAFQMMQIPLVMISKTKLFRKKKLLGNIFFWVGIFTGPSLLCSLYLVI